MNEVNATEVKQDANRLEIFNEHYQQFLSKSQLDIGLQFLASIQYEKHYDGFGFDDRYKRLYLRKNETIIFIDELDIIHNAIKTIKEEENDYRHKGHVLADDVKSIMANYCVKYLHKMGEEGASQADNKVYLDISTGASIIKQPVGAVELSLQSVFDLTYAQLDTMEAELLGHGEE